MEDDKSPNLDHSFGVSGLLDGSDIFVYPSIKQKTQAFDDYRIIHFHPSTMTIKMTI